MAFSILLIVACMIGGGLWGGWHFATRGEGVQEPLWVDMSRTVFLVFLLLLLLRSFVVEPYRVPSQSMLPTIHPGDYLVVNKYAYGLRLPVANVRLLPGGEPTRGDVIAFRTPNDPSAHYIKRVIGLPGDRLYYRNHQLRINGQVIELELNDSSAVGVVRGMEFLGERAHAVQHHIEASGISPDGFEKTVPAGHYFVMGDNRDDSQDSRDPAIGLVSDRQLVGQVSRVIYNGGVPDRNGLAID